MFLEAAQGSAARSEVMASKGPAMVTEDFAPLGQISQSAEDFSLIRELAARNGYGELPLAAQYSALMDDALAAGEGDLDDAAVLRVIRRVAQTPPEGWLP